MVVGAISPADLVGEEVSEVCRNFTLGIAVTLSTPNYPSNYPTDFDCRKVIKGQRHCLSNTNSRTSCVCRTGTCLRTNVL